METQAAKIKIHQKVLMMTPPPNPPCIPITDLTRNHTFETMAIRCWYYRSLGPKAGGVAFASMSKLLHVVMLKRPVNLCMADNNSVSVDVDPTLLRRHTWNGYYLLTGSSQVA